MKVAVGSDHAGFLLKQELCRWLIDDGYEVLDVGTHSTDPVDYPDSARDVSEAVLDGRAARGIVVCGSGAGAAMAANKLVGIRAAAVYDGYTAHQCVEHDDVNVLALGARVTGSELVREVVRNFLKASFTGEQRHIRRLEKIKALEARTAPGPADR